MHNVMCFYKLMASYFAGDITTGHMHLL